MDFVAAVIVKTY